MNRNATYPAPNQLASSNQFEYVEGAFAVIVETDESTARRRLYLSLKAAENAAKRARTSGKRTSVPMVQLKPVAEIELTTDLQAS